MPPPRGCLAGWAAAPRASCHTPPAARSALTRNRANGGRGHDDPAAARTNDRLANRTSGAAARLAFSGRHRPFTNRLAGMGSLQSVTSRNFRHTKGRWRAVLQPPDLVVTSTEDNRAAAAPLTHNWPHRLLDQLWLVLGIRAPPRSP